MLHETKTASFPHRLPKGNTAVKNNIEKQLVLLESPNNSQAYGALKSLLKISDENNCLYTYMSRFIEMIGSDNSYVRTRGLTLIAYNAKWDVEDKIDKIIDTYFVHITDEKPICARQCIKLLPLIAKAKPALTPKIVSALRNANVACYADSMRSLVQNDIRDALLTIGA